MLIQLIIYLGYLMLVDLFTIKHLVVVVIVAPGERELHNLEYGYY